MGWYQNVLKMTGLKQQTFLELSHEEKIKALRSMKNRQRKVEQNIDQGDREMQDIAEQILKSAKYKAATLMEKLRQKKTLMSVYVKSHQMTCRSINALETCMVLEQTLGNWLDSTRSIQIEAMAPEDLLAFMETVNDQIGQRDMENEEVDRILAHFSQAIEKEQDTDLVREFEKLQEDFLNQDGLNQEEKMKMLIDRV